MSSEKKDEGMDLKETEQELLLELKIKTDAFMKKLKEQTKKSKCSF